LDCTVKSPVLRKLANALAKGEEAKRGKKKQEILLNVFCPLILTKTISFISLGHEPNSKARRRCWQRVVAIFYSFATVESFGNDLAITSKSLV
jgi:hypothetical protein